MFVEEELSMYCANCGAHNQDGAHFCQNCGNALQAPGAIMQRPPVDPYPVYDSQEEQVPTPRPTRSRGYSRRTQDPYKDQIKQLKLEIRQMKLYLKEVNTRMSATRAQYSQTSAFVPEGLLKRGYKWFEDVRLLGPQQQKQQLQQQIIQLEQELIGLQQSQMQWKMQYGG
jgi:DNA-binding transcriptional MerR regulator